MAGFFVKTKPRGFQKKPLIISLSKKNIKKATERNLLKRRIRTIMRPVLNNSKLDYTIIVKKEAANMRFGEIKKEILSATNNKKGK